MALARDHLLFPTGIDLLRARLEAEGRMSVYLILAPNKDLLRMGDLTDKAGFAAALDRDIAAASLAADRDPGSPGALRNLAELFQIEDLFTESQLLNTPNPTEAERAAIAQHLADLRQRRATDLDARARKLIALTPRNVASIEFAVRHLQASAADPLDLDLWALSALSNATIYANYKETQLGRVVLEARDRYALTRDRMASGDGPAYSESQLETAYLCPYTRAVRLVDELCAQHPKGEETCILDALWAYPSESQQKDSLYSTIVGQGSCPQERSAPIESLLYEEVALKPPP
jgi:hypothetical protein